MSLTVFLRHDRPPLDFRAEFPAGAVAALVGPSGSGKTSVLRAIAGLLRPREHRVAYANATWGDSAGGTHVPTRLRPIGLVPQHYSLFPHMTVQGNVAAALTHLPVADRDQRARHFLELAHVDGLEARYPHELSGGQRQRVALARAIARGPEVLLLDEPFSSVDRATRKRLYIELRRLHEQLATTTVLVTHDLDEAVQLASYVVLMRHGRVVQAGAMPTVITRPASEDAARLLDVPNIFAGVAEVGDVGHPILRWGPHALHVPGLPGTAIGMPLKFAIHPPNVLLVSQEKPWGRHLENPVPATVLEVMELGGETLVWLLPDGLPPTTRLQMRLPARAASRHGLVAGKTITVCLRPGDLIPLTR